MTDEQMKLGEDEIVKALELCFTPNGTVCSKCPYHKFGSLCKVERDKDVLSLIKWKQAEEIKLLEIVKIYSAECVEKNAEIEELKADKQRLEDDLWNAEINRGFAEQKANSAASVNDVLEELKHTLVINNEGNTDFFDYEYTLETIELLKNRGVIFNV